MNTRRLTGGLLCGVLLCLASLAQAQSEPLSTLRAEREAAEARDQARLVGLLEDREVLEAALDEAREAHEAARQQHRELAARQVEQAARQVELDARQREQGNDLDGILATLARHSGELRDALAGSWLTVEGGELPPRLDDVEVLEREHLEGFADGLMALTAETGRVIRFEAPVAGADGEVGPRRVIRLGDLAAFTENELLRRGVDDAVLSVVERTPREVATTLAGFHAGEGRSHGRAQVFTRDGRLVASFVQDNMIRAAAAGADSRSAM